MGNYVDFYDLKKQVSFEQVLDLLCISLKPSGKTLRGKCPICDDDNPRKFVVTPDAGEDGCGLFYCFSCKAGGDMIKLVALVTDVSQKEAALKIQEQCTVNSNSNTVNSSIGQDDEEKVQPILQGIANRLQPEHELVQSAGITKETCEHFTAGYDSKGSNKGRLAVATFSPDGQLLGFLGVTLKNQNPAVIFPNGFPEPESIIFNANNLEEGSVVDLCSDPMEVIHAYQSGITNTVCFLTDEVSPKQLKLLASVLEERDAVILS